MVLEIKNNKEMSLFNAKHIIKNTTGGKAGVLFRTGSFTYKIRVSSKCNL